MPAFPCSCWKNAFWLITLLYPRSALTALQLFGWQRFDTGTYLKADYSIMVRLTLSRFAWEAGVG